MVRLQQSVPTLVTQAIDQSCCMRQWKCFQCLFRSMEPVCIYVHLSIIPEKFDANLETHMEIVDTFMYTNQHNNDGLTGHIFI